MGITIQVVNIESCSISPNPVDMNQKFTLKVIAVEEEKYLEETFFYSGDIYAGEA